jgi:transposase InsO family protein
VCAAGCEEPRFAGPLDQLVPGRRAWAANAGAAAQDRVKGQCWDNALAESFFASLKGELIDTRAWPTRPAARRAVVEYIAWYNGTRLYSTLGYRSPVDFENGHHEKIRNVA